MISFLYIILAIVGLSFLIFIHELGHYYMARRLGMRVEVFSIGFGRPIYSWMKDGVRWQVGWLLFGGYVKIAGMETEGQNDPYSVSDGFFGKGPWDRIKVAFMGPFVNLVFALLAFILLWTVGGREKSFSEYTSIIGWIDQKSELYAQGIRPGDEVYAYNGRRFESAKDHLYVPMTSPSGINIEGYKIDSIKKEKTPFEVKVKAYPHPTAMDKGIVTTGILQPASYIIYDRMPNGLDNPLPEGSPLQGSGIQYGDRIVWADGEVIYSQQQLSHVLNDERVLLTIQRANHTLLKRVPRVRIQELKLDIDVKEELIDWQFEAELNTIRFQQMYALPYNLTSGCVVQSALKFIDKENEQMAFPEHFYSELEAPLEKGDLILAVEGIPVAHAYDLLAQLQQQKILLIIERGPRVKQLTHWKDADEDFERQVNMNDLQMIASRIGTASQVNVLGDLHLLKPIVPKTRRDFILTPEGQVHMATELLEQKKQIDTIEDPEQKAKALMMLDSREKQLLLGLPNIQDKKVEYNPNPIELFGKVFQEVWYTLEALVTGSLNPKWLSGPIGIVQVVHDTSMVSLKEALYWLGAISLNLGMLNLLPLPVLDGGTICLSFFELITGKKLKPKTLEKLIVPFAILLIGFFIFLTYQDLMRIFSGFFR